MKKRIPDDHDIEIQAINIGWSQSRVGTSGNDDNLRGVNGIDYMYGLAGNDVLRGYGGDDVMFGGKGNDALYGGMDSDQLYGNNGDDTLYGGDGEDTLVGGLGGDWLRGDLGGAVVKDLFVLQKPNAYRGDRVADFQFGADRIGGNCQNWLFKSQIFLREASLPLLFSSNLHYSRVFQAA